MRGLIGVAAAFLRRDLLIARPWAWLMEFLDAVLMVVVWYYLAQVLGKVPSGGHGGSSDYFSFSLIGLALSQYVWRGFHAFSNRIKQEQASGSLEYLWTSAYPLPLLLVLSSLWDFIAATLHALIILGIGVYGFGASLRWEGIFTCIVVGGVTSLAMAALGLLASSWMIAYGRGETFRPLIAKMIPILCGAFFSITLFPHWLQVVAWCFPLTHAMVLARGALLVEEISTAWSVPWAALIGMTAVFCFSGWGTLHLALRQGRINGRIAAR